MQFLPKSASISCSFIQKLHQLRAVPLKNCTNLVQKTNNNPLRMRKLIAFPSAYSSRATFPPAS